MANLITVEEALALVVANAGRQPIVEVALADALGRVLAEDAVADIDSPPFDKALMDGFAVRNGDMAGGRAELTVKGVIYAGAVAPEALEPGTTYQIMTGAPIPDGADAVVIVERSRPTNSGNVVLDDAAFKPGQHVMRRGCEMRQADVVLSPGMQIGPVAAGVLAGVGKPNVKVFRRPTLAVLTTGDELVGPDKVPGLGQIRNSNSPMLVGLARHAGADVTDLGVARDEVTDLLQKVARGLKADILVVTGGVSAGKKDLVPDALCRSGANQVLHHVNLKPGKPVFFGTHPGGLVFGLPGNPVSSLVCFELFVKTALRARQGMREPLPPTTTAELASDFAYPTRRVTYHPARLGRADGRLIVAPLPWQGSPDLLALAAADALMVCPVTDDGIYPAGARFQVLPM